MAARDVPTPCKVKTLLAKAGSIIAGGVLASITAGLVVTLYSLVCFEMESSGKPKEYYSADFHQEVHEFRLAEFIGISLLFSLPITVIGHVIVLLTSTDPQARIKVGTWISGIIGTLFYCLLAVSDQANVPNAVTIILGAISATLTGALAGFLFFWVRGEIIKGHTDRPVAEPTTPNNDLL